MNVHAINQTHLAHLAEQISKQRVSHQFLVGVEERTTQARQTSLHQTLNASIFHNVEKGLRSSRAVASIHLANGIHQRLNARRSEQSVTRFVTREHIIQVAAHALPTRKHQSATFRIKVCSLSGRDMLHGDVLGCHETSENGLGINDISSENLSGHMLNYSLKRGL